MTTPTRLGPDEIPTFLKRSDEPLTDANRMRRLPVHEPVPDRAQRRMATPQCQRPNAADTAGAAEVPLWLKAGAD